MRVRSGPDRMHSQTARCAGRRPRRPAGSTRRVGRRPAIRRARRGHPARAILLDGSRGWSPPRTASRAPESMAEGWWGAGTGDDELDGAPFGVRLRRNRLAAGLTQEALAERAGLGVRTLQSLEGGRQRPQRATAGRLARALGLAAADLARFEAAARPPPQGPRAPRPRRAGPPGSPAGGFRGAPVEARPAVARAKATALAARPAASAPASVDLRSDPHRNGAGEPLRGRSTHEGERRTVTVLCCDIPASGPLAGRLGPEAMHALLSRFFGLAFSEVHRFEGTITRSLGDGFVALFGAPIAHEGSARRAVLAALGIRRHSGHLGAAAPDALQAPRARPGQPETAVGLRIGLHTGPVVFGTVGDDLRTDYAVVGEAADGAARLRAAGVTRDHPTLREHLPRRPRVHRLRTERRARGRSRCRPGHRLPRAGGDGVPHAVRGGDAARPDPLRGPRAGAAPAHRLPRPGATRPTARSSSSPARPGSVSPACCWSSAAPRRRRARGGWRGTASPSAGPPPTGRSSTRSSGRSASGREKTKRAWCSAWRSRPPRGARRRAPPSHIYGTSSASIPATRR